MSIRTVTCIVLDCDCCRQAYHGGDGEYAAHFDSLTALVEAKTVSGWMSYALDRDVCEECAFRVFWILSRALLGPKPVAVAV